MTIGKLKTICERLFRVASSRQTMFLKPSDDNPMPEEIGREDHRDLMYLDVEVWMLSH